MATTLGNGTITFGDGTTLSTASMINSIQRGTGGTNTSVTNINISAVTTSKCMVIVVGDSVFGGYTSTYNARFNTFNSTTQFSITFWSGGPFSYPANYFSWQVIEFK